MRDWSRTRVVVTGGRGFLGRVVCRKLSERGCQNVGVPPHQDYDLSTEEGVRWMYADFRPEVIIHLAAEVGGIGANREHPGRFFYSNLAMGLHLIEHARRNGLQKFVQAGTVCAYPKITPVPFREEDLWNGYPEETNAPYGIAKKSLFVMLDAYQREYGLKSAVVVPVNLYGPGDNFDPKSSHVIPALIRKCVEARNRGDASMTCWGTGSAVPRVFVRGRCRGRHFEGGRGDGGSHADQPGDRPRDHDPRSGGTNRPLDRFRGGDRLGSDQTRRPTPAVLGHLPRRKAPGLVRPSRFRNRPQRNHRLVRTTPTPPGRVSSLRVLPDNQGERRRLKNLLSAIFHLPKGPKGEVKSVVDHHYGSIDLGG